MKQYDCTTSGGPLLAERRASIRVALPFPTLVRGWREPGGERFEEETVLDNLSGHGLHLSVSHLLPTGMVLLCLVRFTVDTPVRRAGPGLITRGVVLRTYLRSDGRYGLATRFTHYRLVSGD